MKRSPLGHVVRAIVLIAMGVGLSFSEGWEWNGIPIDIMGWIFTGAGTLWLAAGLFAVARGRGA